MRSAPVLSKREMAPLPSSISYLYADYPLVLGYDQGAIKIGNQDKNAGLLFKLFPYTLYMEGKIRCRLPGACLPAGLEPDFPFIRQQG
jgi:hypothetical protein